MFRPYFNLERLEKGPKELKRNESLAIKFIAAKLRSLQIFLFYILRSHDPQKPRIIDREAERVPGSEVPV